MDDDDWWEPSWQVGPVGMMMDMAPPDHPRSRLENCRSVSEAAKRAYTPKPKPVKRRRIGFHIPRKAK